MIAAPPAPLHLADVPIGYVQAKAATPAKCSNLGHPAGAQFETEAVNIDSYALNAGSVSLARMVMRVNRANFASCKVAGLPFRRMAFPRVGAESFAYQATGRIQGHTVTSELAFFRRGTRVGAIAIYGLGSSKARQLVKLAHAGLRRLG